MAYGIHCGCSLKSNLLYQILRNWAHAFFTVLLRVKEVKKGQLFYSAHFLRHSYCGSFTLFRMVIFHSPFMRILVHFWYIIYLCQKKYIKSKALLYANCLYQHFFNLDSLQAKLNSHHEM